MLQRASGLDETAMWFESLILMIINDNKLSRKGYRKESISISLISQSTNHHLSESLCCNLMIMLTIMVANQLIKALGKEREIIRIEPILHTRNIARKCDNTRRLDE